MRDRKGQGKVILRPYAGSFKETMSNAAKIVKKAMRQHGIANDAALAETLELPRQRVMYALQGSQDFKGIATRQMIAKHLGLKPEALWPGDADLLMFLKNVEDVKGQNGELMWKLTLHNVSIRSIQIEHRLSYRKMMKSISRGDGKYHDTEIRTIFADRLQTSYVDLWGNRPDEDLSRKEKRVQTVDRFMDMLAEMGKSLADLSKDVDVTMSTVLRALQGNFRQVNLHERIAKVFGKDKEHFWPELYTGSVNGSFVLGPRGVEEKMVVLGWPNEKAARRMLDRLKK